MTPLAGGRVLAEVEAGIGLAIFNQPERLNAISFEMWQGLGEVLDRLAADDAVRVLVLTGAGHRAFISGADIADFTAAGSNAAARLAYDHATASARAKLAAFPKPVIARIRGYCLGAGLAIALQADLRIAAQDSQFGIPGARLGRPTGTDIVRQLTALVGPAHAKSLLFTGARIDSGEAKRIGLVNEVVRDEELSDVVVDLARTIADNAPLSIRAAKLGVDHATAAPDPAAADAAGLAEVEAAVEACTASLDFEEGAAAFLEKRPPRFSGR